MIRSVYSPDPYVPQGMEILIPRSKTDQEGIGEVIALPYGNHLLCPVNALKEWQIKLSSPKTGPVFCRLLKNQQPTRQALSTQSVNTIIKSLRVLFPAACGVE